jgi:hypothetical protein
MPTPTPTSIAGPDLAVYSDSACTKSMTSFNWGNISPGATVTDTVYIKNTGGTQVTLSLSVSNWNPAAANGPITISWNREGTTLAANQVLSATITLSVSPNASGFTTFSVNAVITGTG